MKHWKRILAVVLMALTFLAPMINSTTTIDGHQVDYYHFRFDDRYGNQYTMYLPNSQSSTVIGATDFFQIDHQIIGTFQPKPYNVNGKVTFDFSDDNDWDECKVTAGFELQGIETPIHYDYTHHHPSEIPFKILANHTATLTYKAGHYLSHFLGRTTNQWGVYGYCTIYLYLDSEAPTPPGEVGFPNAYHVNNQYYTSGNVTVTWTPSSDYPTADCEASGVKEYKIFEGQKELSENDTDKTDNTCAISLTGEGVHTITVVAYDNEGNGAKSEPVTITVDQTAPTGALSIQNGAGLTNNGDVTLTVTLPGGPNYGIEPLEAGFCNEDKDYTNNDNYTWSPWDIAQNTLTLTWPLSAGDGEKTVYMKLKDKAGNISTSPVSASIILDTTPPTVTDFKINNDAEITANQQTMLTFAVSDTSGVARMKLSNDGVGFTEEEYQTVKFWPLNYEEGSKTVYAIFIDNAGNATPIVSRTITYRKHPVYTEPTLETLLQGDETWTANHTINGRLIVPAGITLTIGPGVIVTVDGPAGGDPDNNGLIIKGTLIVEPGVTFQADPSKPGWMGIIVTENGYATITEAHISLAKRGLAIINGAAATVSNCVFNLNTAGIHIQASHPTISNCIFQGNTYGIKEDAIGDQRPAVNGCTFTTNLVAYYHDLLTRITMAQLNQIPGNGGNQ